MATTHSKDHKQGQGWRKVVSARRKSTCSASGPKGVEILCAKYNSEIFSDSPFLIYTALKAHRYPCIEWEHVSAVL